MEQKEKEKNLNENNMENYNVFQDKVYGAIFPLPGAQVIIQQYYGKGQEPQQTIQEGKVESAEDREKRKAEVLKALTGRFRFDNRQLGVDNQKQKITNERLANLFRHCLGRSYIPPTQENRILQEQLWVLLMDDRNQCFKTKGEPFFRQTVLNLVGYYASCGLVTGAPLDLAQVLFPDVDANLAKNIKRNITSNVFPEGLVDMLDHYIDQLMNGEF